MRLPHFLGFAIFLAAPFVVARQGKQRLSHDDYPQEWRATFYSASNACEKNSDINGIYYTYDSTTNGACQDISNPNVTTANCEKFTNGGHSAPFNCSDGSDFEVLSIKLHYRTSCALWPGSGCADDTMPRRLENRQGWGCLDNNIQGDVRVKSFKCMLLPPDLSDDDGGGNGSASN
ncbi:hypothetical protein F4819DRAFT_487026 [Hypoxylon fuscum]|nr:hypothetical protein F4819DRAFT_487026 [Hypoxylon fuscum]